MCAEMFTQHAEYNIRVCHAKMELTYKTDLGQIAPSAPCLIRAYITHL